RPHPIAGRLLVVFGYSRGPKVSEHDHLLNAASSRQRWSVEATVRAPVSRHPIGVSAETSDADPLFEAVATQPRERGKWGVSSPRPSGCWDWRSRLGAGRSRRR